MISPTAINNIIMDLFHNQYFDYYITNKADPSSSLLTFRKHKLLRHTHSHSHQSFLSTIDEYECTTALCSTNDFETTTFLYTDEDDEDDKNEGGNNIQHICNIIMIYLIMILIIGGTAIIATEKGIESMMVDIIPF
jgi:hypothetical protein